MNDLEMTQVMPETDKKAMNKKMIMVLSISLAAILIVGGFIYSAVKINGLQTDLDKFKTEVAVQNKTASDAATALAQKVSDNTKKIGDNTLAIANVSDKFSGIDDNLDSLKNKNIISNIEHLFESGIVTDELYIAKMTVDKSLLPTLDVVIDVDTQPSTSYQYQGKGKFNLKDSEVKNMVVALLEQAQKQYNQAIDNSGLKSDRWEKGTVTVTIKNYEIGVYQDGIFTVTKASSLN